ncbi:hypothetical protein OXPF_05520 [Oxobacter pfennigii]|uniref:Uncharacterized protein n=1 Tax=Oxobacter pfennigii TaxID=36849 RepID=A0A0P8WTT1_9CLOT|nr:hypothetical protein [Oxobacter pfennigii]KPU46069.1 hypothetical protein OXPF_05520 [Oxobacter pfennigii]
MKAYNDYMDNISVSDTLHRRFTSYATNTRPARRSTMVRRYAAAFTCLAVILLGMLTVPRLLPDNVTPITDSSHQLGATGPAITKPDNKRQSGAVYHDIDISQITRQEYKAKVPEGFIFKQKLRLMKKDFQDFNIDSHWDEQAHFTEEDIESSLHISIIDPVLPRGDYTTTQGVLVDDATDEIIAYRTDYYYFNKDTMEFQNRFSIFYFGAAHFNTAEIEQMQNVTKTDGEVHIDDLVLPTNAHFKMPHVRKLVYLENGVGTAMEAEADAVITGGKVDQEKSLERYAQADKQLITLMDASAFESPSKAIELTEAYEDPDFGKYLPEDLPSGFAFESTVRSINQERNSLSALWTKGMSEVHWRISTLGEDDKVRITSVADTRNYDLSFYPIPRADSVPDELREIVTDPIFSSEELTLEAVQARADEVSDAGDISDPRMRFGVLYGNILVEINVKGATSEAVFKMLQQIEK